MFQKGHGGYHGNDMPVKYNDKDYRSIAELCRELGVSLSSFRSFVYYRYEGVPTKKKKVLIQDNIQGDMDRFLKKHSKYTAPDGTEYDSFSECCRKNGVNYGAAYNRIKRNNCPEEQIFSKKRIGRIKDHLGNDYPSITDMCKEYGVSINVYKQRIAAGESVKRALTGKTHKRITCKGK